MSASYPASVKTFTNPGPTNTQDQPGIELDTVISAVNDEVTAIETELGAAPKTITEATSPSATPTSVAQYLDMVATQLKAIVGGAHWYTSLTKSLADLVTHIADATIHRSINDSGSAATDLWSASKITTQLATKAASSHTHAPTDITSGTYTGVTISDTLNLTTGAISQAGTAAHITLTPGTSKHVRVTLYSDANGTPTYTANSVILHGWKRDVGDGATTAKAGTITTGVTLATAIIALISPGPNTTTSGSSITPASNAMDVPFVGSWYQLTTTALSYQCRKFDGSTIANNHYFVVSYLIIGTI